MSSVEEDDEQARMKAMLQNYNVTNMNLDHFITQAANNSAIYVDKIDIFPLDITISIGANNYYLPVMYVLRLSLCVAVHSLTRVTALKRVCRCRAFNARVCTTRWRV